MPLSFDFTRRCVVCDQRKLSTRGCTHKQGTPFFICAECNAKPITAPKTLRWKPDETGTLRLVGGDK